MTPTLMNSGLWAFTGAKAALWVLVIALGVRFGLSSGVAGPLLFAGLAFALGYSVWRAPRRKG